MAFSVQDDDATVADANAYIDLAFFKSYHNDRGNDFSSKSDTDLEMAIIKATDYMDTRFSFVGRRTKREQTTEWPRFGAFDMDDFHLDGVPRELKEACAEYAFFALSNSLTVTPARNTEGREITGKRTKVGPIERQTTFMSGPSSVFVKIPTGDLFMRKLIDAGNLIQRG